LGPFSFSICCNAESIPFPVEISLSIAFLSLRLRNQSNMKTNPAHLGSVAVPAIAALAIAHALPRRCSRCDYLRRSSAPKRLAGSTVHLSGLTCVSFDHLVGADEQPEWHCKTNVLCGLEIDNEVNLGLMLNLPSDIPKS
jgi:hypothetical protein